MADWPGGFGATEYATVGVDTATSLALLYSTPASANTKGSYAELSSSLPIDADGFLLVIQDAIGPVDYLIDIAIGAAASEVNIIENLLCASGSGGTPQKAFFPIPIKKGSRVAVRAQAHATNQAFRISITLVNGDFFSSWRLGRATTYGANTATSGGVQVDAGGSANTKGAWSEIISATTASCRALLLCIGSLHQGIVTGTYSLVDVGVGGAGSETVVIPNYPLRAAANTDVHEPPWLLLPCSIASGQRVAVRSQCSTTNAGDRLFEVVLIGFD